ncbi:unnamed protein product [Callosobruchus maculatus]|uniref:Uncharacterized protein n=1 Tax=Callosobruchus maculatus TaxID=64391 RepID=A0A653CUX2_CALMS|nr:unnamed protein product [Callosobruchus maculatus]
MVATPNKTMIKAFIATHFLQKRITACRIPAILHICLQTPAPSSVIGIANNQSSQNL